MKLLSNFVPEPIAFAMLLAVLVSFVGMLSFSVATGRRAMTARLLLSARIPVLVVGSIVAAVGVLLAAR